MPLWQFHLLLAGSITIVGTLLLWWLFSHWHDWWRGLLAYGLVLNVLTFGYYGFDKGRAGTGQLRVPENVLHGLAACGGSLGALAGMQVFRHKTIKAPFRLLFWAIVFLQVIIVAWIVKQVAF